MVNRVQSLSHLVTIRTRLWLALCLLGTVAQAYAQTGNDVEEMVITGTRLEQSIESMPAHVTIIDRAEIEARQERSVLSLLQSVSGVHVSQSSGRGVISSVFVRGAEPNFTVVYIDGVKVNDPNNTRGGSFDFATLNLSEVERIEFVRGAQSSIYGSDGLAGIISITTRMASDEPEIVAEAELGEDELYRTSLYLTGALAQNTRGSFTISRSDDGDGLEGNDFKNDVLDGRLNSQISPDLQVNISGRYANTDAESYPEDSGGPEFAVIDALDSRDQTQLTLAANAVYRMNSKATVKLLAGYADHDEDFDSPGIAPGVRDGVPPNSSDSTLKRTNLASHLLLDLAPSVAVSMGVDYQNEDGDVDGEVEFFPGFQLPTDFDLDRDTVGVFSEIRYQSDKGLALAASLRYDDPEGESSKTNGRVGVQYQWGKFRVFGNWSEGFKLPSFFALGNALVGNPDLKPETSTSWEYGFSASGNEDRWNVTLVGFNTEYKDLIDFDFELFTNINRSKVDNQGFELSSEWLASQTLSLTAHLSYVDIDVRDSNVKLRQRPEWRGGAFAQWQLLPTISLAVDWLYVDSTFDSSVPTGGTTLNSYDRLDIKAIWDVRENTRLWLALDNALDENYQEVIGFPTLDRQIRGGIRHRF